MVLVVALQEPDRTLPPERGRKAFLDWLHATSNVREIGKAIARRDYGRLSLECNQLRTHLKERRGQTYNPLALDTIDECSKAFEELHKISQSLRDLNEKKWDFLDEIPPEKLRDVERKLAEIMAIVEGEQAIALLGTAVSDPFERMAARQASYFEAVRNRRIVFTPLIRLQDDLAIKTRAFEDRSIALHALVDDLHAIEREMNSVENGIRQRIKQNEKAYADRHLLAFRQHLTGVVAEHDALLAVEQLDRSESSQEIQEGRSELTRRRAKLVELLRKTPSANYPWIDRAIRTMENSLEQLRLRALGLELRDLDRSLGRLQAQVDEFVKSGMKAQVRVDGLRQSSRELQAIGEKAAKLFADLPDGDLSGRVKRWAARRDLALASSERARGLIETQERIAGLAPMTRIAQSPFDAKGRVVSVTRNQVGQARSVLAEATKLAESFPEPIAARCSELSGEVLSQARAAEGLLARVDRMITFREGQESLDAQLRESSRLLESGSLAKGRTALFDVGEGLARAARIARSDIPFRDHRRFAELVEELEARRNAADERARVLLAARRRAAGWRALPVDGQPLVPSTAEDSWLRIEFLAGLNRAGEARAALDEFAALNPGLPWRSRVSALRARLDLAEAIAEEERGRLVAAEYKYRELQATGLNNTSTATTDALMRLTERIERSQATAQAGLRAAGLGVTAALALLLASAILVRRTECSRLRRIQGDLERVEKSIDLKPSRRAALLHRVEAALGSFSDEHESASALRERLQRVQARWPVVSEAPPRIAIAREMSDRNAALGEMVASSSANKQSADHCIAWLRACSLSRRRMLGVGAGANARRRPLIRKVLSWLKSQLAPLPSHLSEELEWRAAAAAACADLLPKEVWPRLYQIKAYAWLGLSKQASDSAEVRHDRPSAPRTALEYRERAVQVANRLDFTRLSPGDDREVRLLLGHCLARMARYTEAAVMLQTIKPGPGRSNPGELYRNLARSPLGDQQTDPLDEAPDALKLIASLLSP
jgi:hypothetical protein